MAAADRRDHLDVGERGRPDAEPVRQNSAVADQVIAVSALGRLDPVEGLSRRDDRAPAHAQEMPDQRLDVGERPLLERRSRQRVPRLIVPGGHVLDALLDDPQALADLRDAHQGIERSNVGCEYWAVDLDNAMIDATS